MASPSKETIDKLEELNQKLNQQNDIQELKEEINHIRNNIWRSLNMTKEQLELLNIEDTITNLSRLLFILEQFKYLKDISK